MGLLKHKKESVRAEAIMSLGRIGPDAALAVRELISLLGEKNERIGGEAVNALGRIGASATDPLVRRVCKRGRHGAEAGRPEPGASVGSG